MRRACLKRACFFLMAAVTNGLSLGAPRAAPMRAAPLAMATLGMGSPLYTSLASSAMPMTGLDFLARRAGVDVSTPGFSHTPGFHVLPPMLRKDKVACRVAS